MLILEDVKQGRELSLLDYADEAPLAIINIQCLKWSVFNIAKVVTGSFACESFRLQVDSPTSRSFRHRQTTLCVRVYEENL